MTLTNNLRKTHVLRRFSLADMKKKFSQMLTVFAAALTLSTVPSCIPPELLEDPESFIGLLETLGGSTTSNGESYDEYGNPIYGYDGNQPVYGYDALGDPIYVLAALTADSTVPQWEPRPGAAPRPHGVHRGGPPPHARHRHGDRLKRPGERTRRFGGHAHRRHDRHRDRHHSHGAPGRPDRQHDRHHDRKHAGFGKPDRPDHDKNRMDRGHGKPDRGADRHRGRMERGQGKPDFANRKRPDTPRADRKRPDARPAGAPGKPGRGEGGRKKGPDKQ